MKKPLLTTLGLAGACAACCAIPLAVPLLSGGAALGLASWLGDNSGVGRELAMLLGLAALAALALGAWAWMRQRAAKRCAPPATEGPACAVDKTCTCGSPNAPNH